LKNTKGKGIWEGKQKKDVENKRKEGEGANGGRGRRSQSNQGSKGQEAGNVRR
jgi:hypothetical protein